MAIYSTNRLRGEKWEVRLTGLLLILALLLVRFFSASTIHVGLPNRLQDLITLSASVILESFPFVVLGIVLSIVVQIWLPQAVIQSWLPKNGFLRRLCISFTGVLLPVCECGNLPVARSLVAQGFTAAESITFLLAAPILNPVTLVTTHQAFPGDTRLLIARALGALIIANVIGWLFSKEKHETRVLNAAFITSCKVKDEHNHAKWWRSIELFRAEMGNIMPALFIGSVVAGCIQVIVPREVLLGLGANPVISILAMVVLAFIVSICSNVDAFFALAFSTTFSTGAVVAFLVFGPMIDVKMLALMRTTYTKRTLVQITVLVLLLTIILGLAVNYAF
ncbi:MAG TPA: permease [Verrucomicrobiae bacterium]|nr:permease [Verrucomicrobiae bacterium]